MSLIGEAIKAIFSELASVEEFEAVSDAFEGGLKLTVGDETPAAEMVANLKHVKGLYEAAVDLTQRLELDKDDEQHVACGGAFLLEGLYVNNRLSKHAGPAGNRYSR